MKTTLVSALAGAALLITAGTAVAAPAPALDAVVEASRLSTSTGHPYSKFEQCRNGTRVVGGGLDTDGPAPTGTTPYTIALASPIGQNGTAVYTNTGDIARSFLASGIHAQPTAPDMKTFAICSKYSDAMVYAQNISSVANFGLAKGTVSCPSGSRAVGGGITTTTGLVPTDVGMESYRIRYNGPVAGSPPGTVTGTVASGWTAAVEDRSGATQDFRLFALCSFTSDATLVVNNLGLTAKNAIATGVAQCPAGRHITSGGAYYSSVGAGDPEMQLHLSGPLNGQGLIANTGDVARAWHASIQNRFQNNSFVMKVVASCEGDATPSGPPTADPTPTASPTPAAGPSPAPTDDTPPAGDDPQPAAGTLEVSVTPERVKVNHRRRFTFTVTTGDGTPVEGALVEIAGRELETSDSGEATKRLRFTSRGRVSFTVSCDGFEDAGGTIRVRR